MAASTAASSSGRRWSAPTATSRPWKLGAGASRVSPASNSTQSSGSGMGGRRLILRRLQSPSGRSHGAPPRGALLEQALELLPAPAAAVPQLLPRAAVVDDDVRPGQAFLRLQLGRDPVGRVPLPHPLGGHALAPALGGRGGGEH